MPLVRIDLIKGRTEYAPGRFIYNKAYLGVQRSVLPKEQWK